MTSSAFSSDWIKQFPDPYAVLGVTVTADERRISKRYRQIAKQLHPDQQLSLDEAAREFASQMLTRMVNPSYQRLKQDKGRAETLATLRFKVRRLTREQKLVARGASAKNLMEADEAEVEMLYEKLLSELSENQYISAELFVEQTTAIAELNLVYLRRKMGDPVIREKRTGLVASNKAQQSVAYPPGSDSSIGSSTDDIKQVDYAQRHISRAKAYINNKSYAQAIQELRDAVRLEPKNSNYHSMLGQAYLLQKMIGMAKVHFRQALRLDPNNLVAIRYAKKLEIDLKEISGQGKKRGTTSPREGGRFGFFPRNTSKNENGRVRSKGWFSFFTRSPARTIAGRPRQGWFFELFSRSFSRK